jgi:large subunit ribosomal protein L10
MAISRAKKTEKVQFLAKELETSTTAIIGTFSKLTVAKDFALRKVIREAGGKYRVVKNKLAAVSGEGTKVGTALKGLKGVNSVASPPAIRWRWPRCLPSGRARTRSSSSNWASWTASC